MDVEYCKLYRPGYIPEQFGKALKLMGSAGELGVLELAARMGVSRSYAYQLLAGDAINASYSVQVMLERLLAPGGLVTVDATRRHDPKMAPELVGRALTACGTQQRVAERMGVSRDYLRKLVKGERKMRFGMQVMLEVMLEPA